MALAEVRPCWPRGFRPRVEVVEARILLATFSVPGQYPTITAAVNAANAAPDPSNIVSVGSGTYHESNITITSPLTLISTSGASSTTIDGGNASVPQAGILRIVGTTGNVTIGKPGQGFTLQNPPVRQSDQYINIIDAEGIQAPLTIQNNVLTGLNGVNNPFDVGVLVEHSVGNGTATIQSNTFQEMFQGVLYDLPLGGGSIANNTFQNLHASSYTSGGTTTVYEPEGVFAVTYGGPANNVSGLSILANDFSAFNGLAISVDGGYPGLAPAQFSNVQITNNVITSIGFAANEFRAGITLIDDSDTAALESQGGVVNSVVANNTLQAQTSCASGSVGVWVLGADNNLTIDNNFIQNLDSGVKIGEQVTGAGYASGVKINQNSITGNNIGVLNPSPNLVDASYNYWGTVDATSVKAQANGGVNVAYNPWLGDGTDTSPNPGFQPNLTPLYTDTIKISGNDSVRAGTPYTLVIQQLMTDTHIGTIASYTINFGDGSTPVSVPGNTATVMHTYNPSSQTTYIITATATNTSGTTFQIANSQNVTATLVSTLVVTTFTPTVSGFAVRFNDTLDTSVLNLYTGADSTTSNSGAADVTLTGPSGSITGSLKLDSDNKGFTFVKTGAPLAAGTYSATLFATHTDGSAGVQDINTGNPLDGVRSGSSTGSNYVMSFTVNPPPGAVVSIPDFSRGPNQTVIVPNATGTGLPIRISDGTGVTSVMLVLTYDPTLLSITGVTLASTIPAGAQFVMNATIPGRLAICFTSPTPLSSGIQDIFELTASVPSSAPYRSKEVLNVQLTSMNGSTSLGEGDQAIHSVTYLGNATGTGRYSGLDATRIAQVVANANGATGFGRYPLVDPAIIGGVTSEGSTSAANQNKRTLSGLDAARVAQFNSNISTPQIPPYPGPPSNFATGPDPLLFIPQNLTAQPGGSLSVPVELLQTHDSAVGLDSFDLVLKFDPSAFQFSGILPGNLPAGFQITTQVDAVHGLIYLSATSDHAVMLNPGTLSDLVRVEFQVLAGAKAGRSEIAILASSGNESTSLDGGWLTLVPAPTNSPNNPIDGEVAIGGLGSSSGSSSSSPTATVSDGPSAALLQEAYDQAIGFFAGDPTGGTVLIPLVTAPPTRLSVPSGTPIVASRPTQGAPNGGLVAFNHRGGKPLLVPTDEVE